MNLIKLYLFLPLVMLRFLLTLILNLCPQLLSINTYHRCACPYFNLALGWHALMGVQRVHGIDHIFLHLISFEREYHSLFDYLPLDICHNISVHSLCLNVGIYHPYPNQCLHCISNRVTNILELYLLIMLL